MENVTEKMKLLLDELYAEYDIVGQLVDAKDGSIIYQVEQES